MLYVTAKGEGKRNPSLLHPREKLDGLEKVSTADGHPCLTYEAHRLQSGNIVLYEREDLLQKFERKPRDRKAHVGCLWWKFEGIRFRYGCVIDVEINIYIMESLHQALILSTRAGSEGRNNLICQASACYIDSPTVIFSPPK